MKADGNPIKIMRVLADAGRAMQASEIIAAGDLSIPLKNFLGFVKSPLQNNWMTRDGSTYAITPEGIAALNGDATPKSREWKAKAPKKKSQKKAAPPPEPKVDAPTFRCCIFNDGGLGVRNASGTFELDADEALSLASFCRQQFAEAE